MQQQQHASIIEYSNPIHVQPPTKTICVGTYRSSTIINFSQLVKKDIKINYSNQNNPIIFLWSKKITTRIDRISKILIH